MSRQGRRVYRVMEERDEAVHWMGPAPGGHRLTTAPEEDCRPQSSSKPWRQRAVVICLHSGIRQTRSACLLFWHILSLTKLLCPHPCTGDEHSTRIGRWLWEANKRNHVKRSACWDEGEDGDTDGQLRGVSSSERFMGESLKPGGESWEFSSVWYCTCSLMGKERKLGY